MTTPIPTTARGSTPNLPGPPPWAAAAVVFLLVLALSAAVLWRAEGNRLQAAREQALRLTQSHAQLLQRNLGDMKASNYALAAMVRQGNGSIDNFEVAASQLLLVNRDLLALSISPGGVIRSVVPREGNEALLGFNQLADPAQRVEAIITRNTERLTLAGPLKLAQGGIGVVTRLPIYLPYEDNALHFWGFTNVTVRLADLLRSVDLVGLQAQGYDYSLWRVRVDSGARQVIAASSELPLDTPVRQSLEVPNGDWNLDVAPVRGWRDTQWLAQGVGACLVLSILLAYLAKLLLEQRQHKAGLEVQVMERTAQILATRNQLKSTLDAIRDPLFEVGLDGKIHAFSAPPGSLPPGARMDLVGANVSDLLGKESARVVMGAIQQAHAEGQAQGAEYPLKIGKETRWFELSVARKEDPDAGEPRLVAVARDVTAHHTARLEIRRLAFYDPLTDLPNRRLLQDRLEHALKATVRTRHLGALLLIDMDNFKSLNDTMGHDKGDLLLQQVARRLTGCIRECDTVARLGGDEFVVMIDDVGSMLGEAVLHATTVAEKIVLILGEPYDIAGRTHLSTTSIGVSLFGADTGTVEETLKRSDVAMYQAKAAGRNTLRFFDPAMQATVEARAALEADMRRGLPGGEFHLHFQPQVRADGRVMGAEALARWDHPQRGAVSPAEFITVAEQSGLILDMGQWVLRSACAQLAQWATQPRMATMSLAVNVSVHQFRQSGFVEQVLSVLRESGAPARQLKLEITESMFAYDLEELIGKMTTLKAVGVRFALDDFGTGYSSLSYLKRLPLDQLKIDQSFVRDVLTDPNDAAIARTIVALARSLGLDVIAEGVETAGQRDFLYANGCDFCQGYLFSRPLTADALMAYLDARLYVGSDTPG